MKLLSTMIATLALTASLSFSVQANNQSGWATQAGPLVTCNYADGTSNYIPSMLCKKGGGTFNRN